MSRYMPAFVMVVLLAGCSSPRYLARPADFQYHVKGLFLEYSIDKKTKVLGEIIEVNADEVVLLTIDPPQGLLAIPRGEIPAADIVVSLTSNNPKGIGTWAGLVNVLSISHGYFAAFSIPINIVLTTAIANDVAKGTYRVKYPEEVTWDEMKKFARFPQGIPPQIDRAMIR